jgi:asparagine synthase (glutamine-hydrolysing)
MASVYESVGEASLLNKMLAYDWQHTLADNDLRKVGTMCDLAGVKVSYPLLDPDIVELSLRVPSHVKMRNKELRTFYKYAMREFLPAEILSKTKHGFGLPFGVWMKTHKPLADTVFGFLSALKTRRIVRPEFIDRLIAEQRGGDPGYFGYAVWDLTLLEAWLQAHTKSVA